MPYAAVIFDLDGTLLDTLDDIAESMNQALTELGFPAHGRESYRYLVGDGVDVLARRALPEQKRCDDALVRDLVRRHKAVYATRWNLKTRPYDGVTELLGALRAKGLPTAVLSNKPEDATVEAVGHFFGGFIDIVRGQRPDVPKKPDPAAALSIARQWGIEPERILYLGDTSVDMDTARAAGMRPVGALWGFRTREELLEHGAAELISSPLELLGILDRGYAE